MSGQEQAPASPTLEMSSDMEAEMKALQEHQKNAAKLTLAEEARTLLQDGK